MKDIFTERRSIRRFTRDPVPRETLLQIAEAGRLAPTAVNRQPLSFVAAGGVDVPRQIFPHTKWAGLVQDGSAGPDESTQPAAYIAICVDLTIAKNADTDAGAAAMAMMLQATAMGIATCWLGSINRREILFILGTDGQRYHLHTLIALGYAAMASKTTEAIHGDTAYRMGDANTLLVPKRAAADVIFYRE